jgi:bacitracin transport system ATP-binding protein
MTILSVQHVSKTYGKKHTFQALKDINFDIQKGEFTLPLEIWSIELSTFNKVVLPDPEGPIIATNSPFCMSKLIYQISSGSVIANGQELNKLNQKALAKFRKESLGFIFQVIKFIKLLSVSNHATARNLVN